MRLDFEGELFFWRGPSPWHFVAVPDAGCQEIAAESAAVTYGWGMIPAAVRIGATRWTTSLWPKDGGYLLPVKSRVRDAERLEVGDLVTVRLEI